MILLHCISENTNTKKTPNQTQNRIPVPTKQVSSVNLESSAFGKGLNFFIHGPTCSKCLKLFLLPLKILNADALSANGKRLVSFFFLNYALCWQSSYYKV